MPKIWKNSMGWRHRERLSREAGSLAARAVPPQSVPSWQARGEALRRQLNARLGLEADATPIDLRVHRSIPRDGYRIDLVTYASGSPQIRVTAALFVPDGPGPFPAVLNLHGHWTQGKLAARVQQRGHLLAQHGFVVLSPDAPGSGERSYGEGDFRYHGGLSGAGLYLIGDSLLAWQIRDNRRALDVLASLPVVESRRIGVTGASGGGNQTMWISACDARVAACVPVVSVGTFEVYVTKRNCICETLPAGLTCMEEWELLGLVAPRPLLLLNAYQDSPSFGPEAVTRTAQALRDLYGLWEADERFDARLFNTPHGYWPEMLAAMLGWMQYWLKGEGPGFARALPEIVPEAESAMRCFEPGSWPAATQAYAANKETLLAAAVGSRPASRDTAEARREALAEYVGYRAVRETPAVDEGPWREGRPFATAVMPSPRGIPLPLVRRGTDADDAASPVELIVGASGKDGAFATGAFADAAAAVALDLPGVGELDWEGPGPVGGARLHDTARACLWLGYTLAGEWAECVTALVRWARVRHPGRRLRLVADEEAALAVLLAAALDPEVRACERTLTGLPESFRDVYRAETGSMAMMLPGILKWGDLSDIHHLATG